MRSSLYQLGAQVRVSGTGTQVAKGVGAVAATLLIIPVALIGGLALGSLGGGRR